MRPKHPNQCIGTCEQSNERMRAAWAFGFEHGDDVWVLNGKTGKHSQWQFSHYTLAGARLYCKIEGRYYSRLVNWDNGDAIYETAQQLAVARLSAEICKRAEAQVIVELCDKAIAQIIKELKDEN